VSPDFKAVCASRKADLPRFGVANADSKRADPRRTHLRAASRAPPLEPHREDARAKPDPPRSGTDIRRRPRAAHALDLFVSPKIENLEALKRALRDLFNDPSVDQIDPGELAGDYPAVEYTPPHGHYSMDILTRLGEAFTWQDLAANCDEIELGDLLVQVANPKMLYLMKKDTVRPQDRADAARIREAFGLGDE
jgi:hypothetical protein